MLLHKYKVLSLGQLFCSNFTKILWKHVCTTLGRYYIMDKTIICGIKTKKSMIYLSVHNLSVGTTHLFWTVECSVTDVKKAVVTSQNFHWHMHSSKELTDIQQWHSICSSSTLLPGRRRSVTPVVPMSSFLQHTFQYCWSSA